MKDKVNISLAHTNADYYTAQAFSFYSVPIFYNKLYIQIFIQQNYISFFSFCNWTVDVDPSAKQYYFRVKDMRKAHKPVGDIRNPQINDFLYNWIALFGALRISLTLK